MMSQNNMSSASFGNDSYGFRTQNPDQLVIRLLACNSFAINPEHLQMFHSVGPKRTFVRHGGRVLLSTLCVALLSMVEGPSPFSAFARKGRFTAAACCTVWDRTAIPASHLESRWGSNWKLAALTNDAARLGSDAVIATRSSWWPGTSVHFRFCRSLSSLPLEPACKNTAH